MKPNMLDIHNRRFAPFSPYAWAIPTFFTAQQAIQVYWLWRLNKCDGVSNEERQAAVEFAPAYIAGNFCIAAWLYFWVSLQRAWDPFGLAPGFFFWSLPLISRLGIFRIRMKLT